MGTLGQRVIPAPRAHKAFGVKEARRDLRACKECRVLQVSAGFQARGVKPARMARKVKRATRV